MTSSEEPKIFDKKCYHATALFFVIFKIDQKRNQNFATFWK